VLTFLKECRSYFIDICQLIYRFYGTILFSMTLRKRLSLRRFRNRKLYYYIVFILYCQALFKFSFSRSFLLCCCLTRQLH